ncbi:trehalose utilization protein [Frigoribacterium sp. PhB160]|uniref:ThuA domain-containing protein n=1 Tax=Frigoribacterium sp. PhB160 TaxID=2485192 RepID=UPI000F4753B9|nr:ThuA domain-containing protein [Frigoribacterium sp. PhB160]ROS61298.1 trehalose utilization protein [Frigoribacterium sp. PhB160]
MTDAPQQPTRPTRVVVWNEFVHETRRDETVLAHYPDGIHEVVAAGLRELLGDEVDVSTATLAEPEHGLTEERLAETDVLLWWGHIAHDQVSDEVVERVVRHVQSGMGIIVLHSGHYSKPFTRLLGTTCSLRWRNAAERELVWTVAPTHPIAEGVPDPLVIPEQETYGEYFDVPTPDELIFLSTFTGGEVFRSGATWRRGLGKLFYFSPGDQEYPVYHQAEIRRVLANGVRWARPTQPRRELTADLHPLGWFEGDAR